jgi:hypothetical protein
VELCESGSKTACGHGSESSNRLTAASKMAGDHGSESLNRATVAGSGGLGRRRPDLLEQGDDNSTRGDVGIDAAQGGAARWVMAVATQRRVWRHGEAAGPAALIEGDQDKAGEKGEATIDGWPAVELEVRVEEEGWARVPRLIPCW